MYDGYMYDGLFKSRTFGIYFLKIKLLHVCLDFDSLLYIAHIKQYTFRKDYSTIYSINIGPFLLDISDFVTPKSGL